MKKLVLSSFSLFARLLPLPVKQALYRFPPLARLIRGSMNAAVSSGLSEVEIAAGPLQGYRILLNMKAEKSRWLGTYEPELATVVAELLQPGMVVYDVGANIGYVSLLLAHYAGPQGKVYAFEALPANQDRIRQNITLNRLAGRISLVPQAVADRSGEMTFLVHDSVGMGKLAGSAGRNEEEYQAEIRVPSLSLDEFVFEHGNPAPQIVKMDIEGGEVLALPGMLRILREARPILLLELHGPESEKVAWQTLQEAGYTLHRMQPGLPPIETPSQLDWKAYLVARHP